MRPFQQGDEPFQGAGINLHHDLMPAAGAHDRHVAIAGRYGILDRIERQDGRRINAELARVPFSRSRRALD